MHVEYKDSSRTLYSILDTPANLHETLERYSETDSEHEERQERHRDTFLAFRDRLTEQECHIILDHCGLDAFRTMMGLNPDIADRQHFGRHQVFGEKPNLGDGKLTAIPSRLIGQPSQKHGLAIAARPVEVCETEALLTGAKPVHDIQ